MLSLSNVQEYTIYEEQESLNVQVLTPTEAQIENEFT
jgi:hypothetical protein